MMDQFETDDRNEGTVKEEASVTKRGVAPLYVPYMMSAEE
jgi:hypothetical protein